MKIKFKIKRANPVDSGESVEPYIQAYTVEAAEGMTVLEAIMKIADEQDPTLSFRRSCRSAICGSCAVEINGFSRLACNTQVIP
ncbi:MAG: 2Fe-2S iron-sulfur cluster-binding protein, partial [Deltaproteobacteria bacterium]|nr:2Fe-2S iron-sulfur cluster-binding protein [Deltaproteobacteria bacterium]